MTDAIARSMQKDKIRKSEDKLCPPRYCRHEFRVRS